MTAIFTLALMTGSIVEISRNGFTLWASAVLIYLVLVAVTLWVSHDDASKNISTSPSTIPHNPGGQELQSDEQPGVSEKTAQEIILETIRTKGKAQRHDLLPQVGLSRSSLGRLLDQMEAKGLIRQEGDRKASQRDRSEGGGREIPPKSRFEWVPRGPTNTKRYDCLLVYEKGIEVASINVILI